MSSKKGAKVDLSAKLAEAKSEDKFVKVGPNGKYGGFLKPSGMARVLAKNPDFVYLTKLRLAGNKDDVEMVIEREGLSEGRGERVTIDDIEKVRVEAKPAKRATGERMKEPTMTLEEIAALATAVSTAASKAKKTSPTKKRSAKKGSPKKGSAKKGSPRKGGKKVVSKGTEATVAAVTDLVKRLRDVEKGLDISKYMVEEGKLDGVVSKAVKELSGKLTKIPVPYGDGFLITDSEDLLAGFLKKIGHKSSDVNAVVAEFRSRLQEVEKKKKGSAKKTSAKKTSAKKSPKKSPKKARKAPAKKRASKEEIEEVYEEED